MAYSGCLVEGCRGLHEARGYCSKHYQRLLKGRDPHEDPRAKSRVYQDSAGWCVGLFGKNAKGRVARISEEDREKVAAWRWGVVNDYAKASDGRERPPICMHRLIMGLPPIDQDRREVDHINGDKLDNRRENLRLATREEQMQNKKPWGKTGHRGVFWEAKKQLYRVEVAKDGKRYRGGRHKRLEDAIEAARALRERLFTHNNEARNAR